MSHKIRLGGQQPIIEGKKPGFYVFCYGTLQHGFKRRNAIDNDDSCVVKSLGDYKLTGYKIFISENYDFPIIQYTGNKTDIVVGEMIACNAYAKGIIQKIESGYIEQALPWSLDGLEMDAFSVYLPPMNIVRAFGKGKGLKSSFRHFCNTTKEAKFKNILNLAKK